MRTFALPVVLLAACAAAAADEAVGIKPPALKAGDRYKVTKTERTKTAEAYEGGGKKANTNKEETREVVYTEEVLTAGADPETPAKRVRVYEKYEAKGDKDAAAPPLNTPVTITKSGDKFTFTAAKPLGDFAKKLDEEFNNPSDEPTTKDFLPGKPVKPGEAWKIDAAKFAKSLPQDKVSLDAAKSAMTGKLLKAYQKGGKPFGVLELKAEFPVTGLGAKGPPLKSGSLRMTTTADVCLDGTEVTENTKTALVFEIALEIKDAAMNTVSVSVKSDGVLTTVKEPLPKK